MIKTIIFDIGGVITDTDFEGIYSNFGKRIGLSPEFVIQYHRDKINDLLLGNISLDDFWNDMKIAGADPSINLKEIWIEEGIQNRTLNNDLLKVINKLRTKYSVGVLTNVCERRLLVDEKINLYSNFDYHLLSCREHLVKPDPRFYQKALDMVHAKPEEAIFIDDSEKHVSGAEAVGIKGILYVYPENTALLENLRQFGVVV